MGRIKAKTHLQRLGFSDKDKKESKHDIIQTWAYENIEKIISETVMKNNEKPYKVFQPHWESPVVQSNGYGSKFVIGFVDLYVNIQGQHYFNDSKQFEDVKWQVFIEIKTQIPNLGELIRQMKTYQAYEGIGKFTHYMIIAPDDRFKKILNEQGFWFYKYKDPTLLF